MGATAGLAIMGGSSFVGGLTEASAAKSQANYQKQQYEQNAVLAEMQAQDAIRRGDKDAAQVISKGKRMAGEQRAALAASGVDVNYGSAAELQDETLSLSERDATTARINAWREAWGYKTQANNYAGQGSFAQAAGIGKAKNSVMTGGMQALGQGAQAYGSYKKNNP